jgi:hypothetical protein
MGAPINCAGEFIQMVVILLGIVLFISACAGVFIQMVVILLGIVLLIIAYFLLLEHDMVPDL